MQNICINYRYLIMLNQRSGYFELFTFLIVK